MSNPFNPDTAPAWGPSGQTVYERTYARPKADGTRETWAETVERVVNGNIALVDAKHIEAGEADRLKELIYSFSVLPAGRHLWASGVAGRQYLFNCHVAGWGKAVTEHFRFTFLRLMEGGGVGSNYSSRFLKPYGLPKRQLTVHVVCDPSHPDYQAMKDAGVLSERYSSDWAGAFEVADSREGWADALTDFMETYWAEDVSHVDRVYDVTNVRQEGARLKTFGGYASGPKPFAVMMNTIAAVLNGASPERFKYATRDHLTPLEAMEIDHAIAECVVSGGNRRSARMAIVEWDDPYIFDFLKCKADSGKHWTTNISVGIDNTFANAVQGDPFGISFKTIDHALAVHAAVIDGMLSNGEPGYWNRELSQEGETGEVIATNPCGEITLEAWENCNLGHVNLSAFVVNGKADLFGMVEAQRLMARFLIRATYGDVTDPKQAERLAANRRIGVGHFGVQGFLAKTGVPYSKAPRWVEFKTRHDGPLSMPLLLDKLYGVTRQAADKYAFELRIPAPVKVTTVAPTGTIAKLAGATEGIHPIYAKWFIRRIRFAMPNYEQMVQVAGFRREGYHTEKCVYDKSGNTEVVEIPTRESLMDEVIAHGHDANVVESVDEISLKDMLNFQAMYQEHYADNAVSFTVNVPDGKVEKREALTTIGLFLKRLKGTTLMPDGTRPQAPYERISQEEFDSYKAFQVANSVDDECATGACPVK